MRMLTIAGKLRCDWQNHQFYADRGDLFERTLERPLVSKLAINAAFD
jgi:hypothetical protein